MELERGTSGSLASAGFSWRLRRSALPRPNTGSVYDLGAEAEGQVTLPGTPRRREGKPMRKECVMTLEENEVEQTSDIN